MTDPSPSSSSRQAFLDTQLKPTAWDFASAIAMGAAPEIACFGPRGDGKSWAALWGMVMHAAEHHSRGYPLPVTWLGVRDTFVNHVGTTHKSLLGRAWEGGWELSQAGKLATYRNQGAELVKLELVGAKERGDANKLRTECHCAWFDETAPAMDISEGIGADFWGVALSSVGRLPTHAPVAVLTSNYGDEEDWAWQRFYIQRATGTLFFRIPGGERAPGEYRARLAVAYANRPDLKRRLLDGQPGFLELGEQVAAGFNADDHVLYGPAPDVDRHARIWMGTDGGESHTWVTVIGQRVRSEGRGRIRIHAALLSSPSGCRQHMKDTVLPWLSEHAPWIIKGSSEEEHEHRYDPACDTEDPGDSESNPLRTMRTLLPGGYLGGPVSWAGRRDPLLSLLRSRDPIVEIVAGGAGNAALIRALNGGWHYPTGADGRVTRDKPKKPNHPHEDYGDALCYLLAGMAPLVEEQRNVPLGEAIVASRPWDTGLPVGQARVADRPW